MYTRKINKYLLLLITAVLQYSAVSCSKGSKDNPGPDGPAPVDVKNPSYQFTTTNWDDGWVSVVKDDWVETTKGTVKVLLHYPKTGTEVPADPAPYVNNAWSLLSASRYRNLQNFKVASPSVDFQRAYLGFGTATEISSGQPVFVGLFKKGNSGWIEIITPDKKTFVQQFGVDPETITWSTSSEVWTKMRVMSNYNRFAVAVTDIAQTGKWTNNFGSNTFYFSMYTGLGVGMSSYSATEEYTFGAGNNYQWQLFVANSGGGISNLVKVKSAGQHTLPDNWSIHFSDIEGKAVTYPMWYAAVKGGRVLFINGNPYSWTGK